MPTKDVLERTDAQDLADYKQAAEFLRGEVNRLLRALAKIDEYAEDGQNGSATYALDRLSQIRKTVAVFIERPVRRKG